MKSCQFHQSDARIFAFATVLLCMAFTLPCSLAGDKTKTKDAFDVLSLERTGEARNLSPANLRLYDTSQKVQMDRHLGRLPEKSEGAWIAGPADEGAWWVGLHLTTDNRELRILNRIGSRYWGLKYLFHNGRPVIFQDATGPTPIEGRLVSEIFSRESIQLKAGDELRLDKGLARHWVGPLRLYRERPTRGVITLVAQNSKNPASNDFYRVSLEVRAPQKFAGKAIAAVRVKNVLTKSANLKVRLEILDYFTSPVTVFERSVTLPPRKEFAHELEWVCDRSDRYRAVLTVTDPDGSRIEKVRQILTPRRDDFRQKWWLNNAWEYKPIEKQNYLNRNQLKGGKWKRIHLPFKQKRRAYQHIYWYRRSFRIPTWVTSPRLFLVLTRVGYDAQVFINGRKVASTYDPHSPHRIEITAAVDRKGVNLIEIGTRDNIASLSERELKKPIAAVGRSSETIAPGGIALLEEVYIEAVPDTHIDEVHVETSYRKKEISVRRHVAGASPGPTKIRSSVRFKGRLLLPFGPDTVSSGTVVTRTSWPEPVLWSPWEPHLLCLTSELLDADGRVLDIRRTRFGFRETWSEGIRFFINGTRIKGGAIAMARYDTRRAYRDYIRMGKSTELLGKVHMHPGRLLQDINDEEGLLVFLSAPNISGPTGQKFQNDQYWENAERMVLAAVNAYRNHPSIIAWYPSNEWARLNKLAIRRLRKLGEKVRAADPTRLVSFGCDLDLEGWNDHISVHYPIDHRALRQPHTWLPEATWWYPAGQTLKKGMMVPCGQVKTVANIPRDSPIRWGEKPIFINESGWKFQFKPPSGFAAILGDQAYTGLIAAHRSHLECSRWFLSRHRDVEPVLITPWHWCGHRPFLELIPRIDIVVFESYTRWYEGEQVAFRVNLHHDLPQARSMTFAWELRAGDRVLVSGDERLMFEPAELKRKTVSFAVPSVTADTSARLTFTLLDENGTLLRTKAFDCRFFPRVRTEWPDGLAAFDPKGDTLKFLMSAGIRCRRLREIRPDQLDGVRAVIIGRNTTGSPEMLQSKKVLTDYVAQGGSILFFAQEKERIDWFPAELSPMPKKHTSIAHIRAPNHPVFDRLADSDLRFWFPNHLVSAGDFIKPEHGGFIPLLDSSYGDGGVGMEYTPLIELRHGKGLVIASQIDFETHYDRNPVAARLLANILKYLTASKKRSARTACLLQGGGDVKRKLARIGLVYETPATEELGEYDAVFAEMAVVTPRAATQLKRFVEQGGTLTLHGITRATRKTANRILDGRLRLLAGYPSAYKGRLLRLKNCPAIDGLSNADFFWKKTPTSQDYTAAYISPRHARESILEFPPIHLEGGQTQTYPAGLATIRLGRGRIIVDQINWETPNSAVKSQSNRIASVLFANLGFRFKHVEKLVIPKNLAYTPLDISNVLNRALADEVDGDGKGGWTDQGRIRDMRPLKPGKKTYHGVPFRIEPGKSCLVLRSRYRKPTVPSRVDGIPVGGKAAVLYFLHASAWTRGKVGAYRINYANGKTIEIELVAGRNMRDWIASKPMEPFHKETNTQTRAAWIWKAPQSPKTRAIYMMAWPNPYPDVKIESFDFLGYGTAIPVLLAVTVGRKPSVAADITIQRGNRTQAESFYRRAQAAFKAGNGSRGVTLLEKAVAADFSFADAHARLGRYYVAAGKPHKAERELRIVLAIDKSAFDVYLMLGELLESQKRFEDAFHVYNTSLDVDLNQPRAIEARDRASKRLGR